VQYVKKKRKAEEKRSDPRWGVVRTGLVLLLGPRFSPSLSCSSFHLRGRRGNEIEEKPDASPGTMRTRRMGRFHLIIIMRFHPLRLN
jgi:hypothetical protein